MNVKTINHVLTSAVTRRLVMNVCVILAIKFIQRIHICVLILMNAQIDPAVRCVVMCWAPMSAHVLMASCCEQISTPAKSTPVSSDSCRCYIEMQTTMTDMKLFSRSSQKNLGEGGNSYRRKFLTTHIITSSWLPAFTSVCYLFTCWLISLFIYINLCNKYLHIYLHISLLISVYTRTRVT